MRHFPIFMKLENRKVIVTGSGDIAEAKLRLLLKSPADIVVFATQTSPAVQDWADTGRITLINRTVQTRDLRDAALVYAASGSDRYDAAVAAKTKSQNIPFNWVDNLERSGFITPAMVDRSPVTIAIGTEGTAPVLARQIKSKIERMLPSHLGSVARLAQGFRARVEATLPHALRRHFWKRAFDGETADLFAQSGPVAAQDHLETLLQSTTDASAQVYILPLSSADPRDLTERARQALEQADMVIAGDNIPTPILELARREARFAKSAEAISGGSTVHLLRVAGPQDQAIRTSYHHHAKQGVTPQVLPFVSTIPPIAPLLEEVA